MLPSTHVTHVTYVTYVTYVTHVTHVTHLIPLTALSPRNAGFFQCPFVPPVGMTVAMCGEKAAAMLPEPGPNALPIRLWYLQSRQGFARKILKASLAMRGRQGRQFQLHLEQEHQPVALALITVLTRQAGQMQVGRRDQYAEFLVRLAASASVGRLARVRLELPAARA